MLFQSAREEVNNGSVLFLLQNMCIEFLGLDGDKKLIPLPNSLLFSCFKQQRIFSENSRKSCCFVLFLFSCFTYIFLAESWRKAVMFSSAGYLLSELVLYSAKLW